MDVLQAFFQRYDPLYAFYIGTVWKSIPEDLMRRRPYPQVNSIAWNVWHLTRVEDAGLNLFVGDRSQVLDESPDSSGAGWMQRLNLPWRHQGSGMTFPEVDELNERVNLQALHEYSDAVQARTREILAQLNPERLDDILEQDRLHTIIVDEGLAHSNPEALIQTYAGWPKSKCLMNFGLTHPFLHIGEIDVIASLLGIQF
jgi:hypothetical protein